ncbi:MAG: DUF4838 domain-containing protein [Sedimentisphaerales bacterium]|nr:DUF4838 domain-containing protein [Sedimentisphaerales bacterium]
MSLRILVCAVLVMVGVVAGCGQAELVVARDGAAVMDIVVGAEATVPEHYAAGELAEFLGEVTGAEYEVRETMREGVGAFLVGVDAARMVDPEFSIEGLEADTIVMKSVGDNLILAGDRPRGTVYAVYTFLQDEVGCRWWTPSASTIPQAATLTVGDLDVVYTPPFEYRDSFWFNAFDGDWAARNRCNGAGPRLTAEQGGKHVYEGFVHTFSRLIPPSVYFAEHPEWFASIDGERMAECDEHLTQLCLTNEEMREELVSNLRRNLQANPDATIASVSQNDGSLDNNERNLCGCAACRAVEEAEGGPSGLILRFVNSVAAELEDEFPNVTFSTLAYQFSRRPPLHVRPCDNVCVRLCSIECSFSVPLSDDRNAAFRDDIVGWSQIADRLYVWDYVGNYRHYLLPHANLRVLDDNVRFFRDHNVVGLMEQGNYQSLGSNMAEMKAWMLAQLMWNPDQDGDALMREFARGYYGAAGDAVMAYVDCFHDAVDESGDYMGCFAEYYDLEYLSFDVMSRCWEFLKEAEAAVADAPEYKSRVEMAELSVMYVFLYKWQEFRDAAVAEGVDWPMDDDINVVYADFLRIVEEQHVTHLRERGGDLGFSDLAAAVQAAQ